MTPTTELLRFVLVMPNGPTKPDFLLKDLPGSGRRIDVFCRTLAACFDWAPVSWPREKIEVVAVLAHRVILTATNPETPPVGEVAWAERIQQALRGETPGFIRAREGGLSDLLDELIRQGSKIWVLLEDGRQFGDGEGPEPSSENSFMLGDHKGFDEKTQQIIEEREIPAISLGKISYLSSHCVAVVIAKMERMLTHE